MIVSMETIERLHGWLTSLAEQHPHWALVFFFVGIVIIWTVVFRIAMHFDRGRVIHYLRTQRAVLEDFRWRPFGPGWFGERRCRIYRIQYRDVEDRVHTAYVKTSLWSGVYLSQDKVVFDGPARSVRAAS